MSSSFLFVPTRRQQDSRFLLYDQRFLSHMHHSVVNTLPKCDTSPCVLSYRTIWMVYSRRKCFFDSLNTGNHLTLIKLLNENMNGTAGLLFSLEVNRLYCTFRLITVKVLSFWYVLVEIVLYGINNSHTLSVGTSRPKYIIIIAF